MSNEEQSKKYLLFNIERIIALLSRLENNRPLIKDDCDLLKSMDVNKLLTKENVNVLFTKISEANDLTVNNDLLHTINAKIEKIILNLEYRATDNNKELLALRYDCLSEHHNTAKEALDYNIKIVNYYLNELYELMQDNKLNKLDEDNVALLENFNSLSHDINQDNTDLDEKTELAYKSKNALDKAINAIEEADSEQDIILDAVLNKNNDNSFKVNKSDVLKYKIINPSSSPGLLTINEIKGNTLVNLSKTNEEPKALYSEREYKHGIMPLDNKDELVLDIREIHGETIVNYNKDKIINAKESYPKLIGNIKTFTDSEPEYIQIKTISGNTITNLSSTALTPVFHSFGNINKNNCRLNNESNGFISICEIQGNTLTNLCKENYIINGDGYSEKLQNLYPNTDYFIKFISNKHLESKDVYLELGGVVSTPEIKKGINKIRIRTESSLSNDRIIIGGQGLRVKDVMVVQCDDSIFIDDIKYFKGTKSSFESAFNMGDNKYHAEIGIRSRNLFNGVLKLLLEGDTKKYITERIYIDGTKYYTSNHDCEIELYNKSGVKVYSEKLSNLVTTYYKDYPIDSNISYMIVKYKEQYKDIQIEEGTEPTSYTKYHNDHVDIALKEPLTSLDKIILADDKMLYCYRGLTDSYELLTNPITLQYGNDAILYSITDIPVKYISTESFSEYINDLKPNTRYDIIFNSNKEGRLNFIELGGSKLSNIEIEEGRNIKDITTEELSHNSIVIDGEGFIINDLMIIEHQDDNISNSIEYFKGTKSSFDNKEVIITTSSGIERNSITLNLQKPLQLNEKLDFRSDGVYHVYDNDEYFVSDINTELKVFKGGELKIESSVPVFEVLFKSYEQEIKYLEPNTRYKIRFYSKNAGMINISLAGESKKYAVVIGENTIDFRTPEILENKDLIIEGKNLTLTDVVLVKNIDLDGVKYIDDIESTFESNKEDNKYVINIDILNEYDTVIKTRTIYLNSPLMKYDKLIYDNNEIKHYHNTAIDDYIIKELEEPYYETIEFGNMKIENIPPKSKLRINTDIPLGSMMVNAEFKEDNLGLKPDTEYLILITSDKEGEIEKITLGDSTIYNLPIVRGVNKIMIITPSIINSDSLCITKTNVNLKHLMILENSSLYLKDNIEYFKGTESLFEGKLLKVIVESYDRYNTYHVDDVEILLSTPLYINDKIVFYEDSFAHYHASNKIQIDNSINLIINEELSDDNYLVYSIELEDKSNASYLLSNSKVNNNGKNIEISIPVDKIITDVDDYLYDNPIEIVYELSDPYYEKLDINELTLGIENNTTLYLDSLVPCKEISFSYNTSYENVFSMQDRTIKLSQNGLNELINVWNSDYSLRTIEWQLYNLNILSEEYRLNSMDVISRYVMAHILIQNDVYNIDVLDKQIDDYFNHGDLTNEEYIELKELIQERRN